MEYFDKYGVDIALIDYNLDKTTVNGKMVSRIMVNVSQNEIYK